MITCHSEYGKIKRILLKSALNAFESKEKIDSEWKKLNYLSSVNLNESVKEYDTFKSFFSDSETYLLPQSATSVDSIYCRDTSLATDYGLILFNMGKQVRKSEPKEIEEYAQKNSLTILGWIESPGTCEGGDMCWLDTKTLAIGHTYRTNSEGINQIRALLEPKGIEVLIVELPHYKGPEDVFHLMSIISPIDQDLAMVYSPLMPIYFREELLKRKFHLVECPDSEFESMGCNVLALAPRKCLIVEGNPESVMKLKAAGCEVMEYKGEEISKKGCGGPTCLTRPLEREI